MSWLSNRRNPKFPRSVAAANLLTRDPTAMLLSAESLRSTEMKTLPLASATRALLTAVTGNSKSPKAGRSFDDRS
jgi:hypothetical protein